MVGKFLVRDGQWWLVKGEQGLYTWTQNADLATHFDTYREAFNAAHSVDKTSANVFGPVQEQTEATR